MGTALELVAGAVAGRSVPLERGRTSRTAYTDGTTIFLDDAVDAGSPETRRAVMAQAALIGSGSLDRDVLRKLQRHGPKVVDRYLALEIVRAAKGADAFLPRWFVAALEPFRRGGTSRSAVESLRRAKGLEKISDPLPWFGELRPTAALRARAAPASGQAPGDQARAADLAEEHEPVEEAEATGARSRIMELLSAPMRNPLGDGLQRMLGMGRAAGEGSGGAELPISGRRSGKVGPDAQTATGSTTTRNGMAGHLVLGATYPEWDVHRGRYRAEWCRVGEFDPAPDRTADGGSQRIRPALLRELARLGLVGQSQRCQTVGDGLDLTALVDLRTRMVSGHGGEPAIYIARRRTAQRLGVLVLLDATGSTAERNDGQQVFDRQQALTDELTSVLDRLGVRVATYAFYSNGRKDTRFLRCKTFEELWGRAARQRLQAVRPTGFTRFGVAVRHGTQLLASRSGTEHQLLVVIGDGVAYDHRYESRYAVADGRRAIAEAGDRGVAVVGLSVAPLTGLEPIWSPQEHRVVANSAALARVAADLFGAALRRSRSTSAPQSRAPASRRNRVVGAV